MTKPLILLLGVAIGVGCSLGARELSQAILSGKEKRFISNVKSVALQLERYRSEHATYPVACDTEALAGQLGRLSNVSLMGGSHFRYCSDGQKYVLVFMPFGARAYSGHYGAPVVAANDQLVAWPKVRPDFANAPLGREQ